MRPIQLADIETAARVLVVLAPSARPAAMRKLIGQTEKADRYRLAKGLPHPRYGTGTLMSSAQRWQKAPRPDAIGPDVLAAYAVVLSALLDRASHQSS